MNDQLPQFTQGDWVLTGPYAGGYDIHIDGSFAFVAGSNRDVARLASLSPKIFRALVALASVAKVQSDAEYRAVLDARDVIAEVMGS